METEVSVINGDLELKSTAEKTDGKEATVEEGLTEGDQDQHSSEVKQTWQNAVIKDKSLWFKFKLGKGAYAPEVRFNPVVASVSIILIAALIAWCIIQEDAKDVFAQARLTVANKFSWLYMGTVEMLLVFVICIYFSKYGSMKLGKDDDEPDFPDGSWFCMLFACGLGVGLFFYGVAEPILHYTSVNRYTADRFMRDNEVAQFAMNTTILHWGFHGWVVYALLGMVLAFISFRKGLPMTMKSCFYPLVGDRIFGWIGNIIDVLSLITTVFGVCASLGIGSIQLNSGLREIFPNLEKTITVQVIIIWVVMAVATISVLSGLGSGIRRISEICFGVGMFLLIMVFMMDDPGFLLNLMVQSLGHYLQYFVLLGFRTDAFEQLNITSRGGAARGRLYEDGVTDGSPLWMDGWTVFFWGWWISWGPFVGMFIAKISKGRTIREFINGTMTAPVLYVIIWLSVFGGSALRAERQAASLHSPDTPFCCPADTTILDWTAAKSNPGGDWMTDLVASVTESNAGFGYEDVIECTKLTEQLWRTEWRKPSTAATPGNFEEFYKSMDKSVMSVSKDSRVVRFSCLPVDDMWFALMDTKGPIGKMLSMVSLFGILLYFVTSLDSGSLVLDIMASNGDQNPPRIQRVFWAVAQGATASALLVAGGSDALSAVQTAAMMSGLLYAMMLCFLAISLWRGLAMEVGDLNPYGADFKIGIIDPFTVLNPSIWLEFAQNLFLTPLVMYRTSRKLGNGTTQSLLLLITAYFLWCTWIILHVANLKVDGLWAVGWTMYFTFALLLAIQRSSVRDHFNINGNPVEDYFAVLVLYPSVAIQLDHAFRDGPEAGLTTLVPTGEKGRGREDDTVVENGIVNSSFNPDL